MMFFATSFFWLAGAPIQGALIRVNGDYWPCAVFSGLITALGTAFVLLSRWIRAREVGSAKV
jgi:hypothetical protein